jgi:hypothetical protein
MGIMRPAKKVRARNTAASTHILVGWRKWTNGRLGVVVFGFLHTESGVRPHLPLTEEAMNDISFHF